MNHQDLPANAFIAPDGANRTEVDRFVDRAVSEIIDHAATASSRSPLPSIEIPREWASIPEEPVGEDEIIARLRRILDGCMNAANPGYIGHMDPIASTASILGALAAGAVNNNMLSVELSPSFSQLEANLMREMTGLFGLGPDAGGLLIAGGSLANLQALAVARNVVLGVRDTGISQMEKRPVFFASEVAHTSIQKAAMMLGLGTQGVHALHTDANARIDLDNLREEIAASRERKEAPFAIVAIAGTTITGNIDHLPEIAAIAREHGLWLHVDAAYGGTLMFSENTRHLLRGIDLADSITFNPQKWLYVTKVCASVMFKRRAHLTEAFRTPLPYMMENELINSGEICVQGTRHPDGIKLWLTLQHLGRRGLQALIDNNMRMGRLFTDEVKKRPHLELATEPEMNIVCFRAAPKGMAEERLDALNEKIRDHLLHSVGIHLSIPWYHGRRWLRTVLINPHTTPAHIERLFAEIDAQVASL